MPRRSILTPSELESLVTIPSDRDNLIRYYTLSESDISIIGQHRGSENKLGFAIQLCYMRYPGIILNVNDKPSPDMLRMVAQQLKISVERWDSYGQREQTRREHINELQKIFGFKLFTMNHYKESVHMLTDLALQTDKGIVLANAVIENLQRQSIMLPALNTIERICAEVITRANRQIYQNLTASLSTTHHSRLDELLKIKDGSKQTVLSWLRESPLKSNSRYVLEHIERLKALQEIDLPAGIEKQIHQNRLLKMAREGGQMKAADLAKFEPQRRYATLVALISESTSTVIDEIIDLHDRIMGKLFSAAKNKQKEQFHSSGKAINDKVRLYSSIGKALLSAKQNGSDPFAAIESIMTWEAFEASITEAEKLAEPEDFSFLPRLGENYATLRRYVPDFLLALKFKAAPAASDMLEAIELLREMNADNTRKVPEDAPIKFVKSAWRKLVITEEGIDRRYYEICALSELKNALRSGDIWVQGSRQFKDFDEYLIPSDRFTSQKSDNSLSLAINTNCDQYLHDRIQLLEQTLNAVNRLAAKDSLPDAIITTSGLKVTPLDAIMPDKAQSLIDQVAALLPHVKITDLLLEVDNWTDFTRHFEHLKTNEPVIDRTLLLTTILADGINLGLTKMAESCPGTTYDKLSWLQSWHIRDETYSKALAELVNAQSNQSFAEHWGDGTTSSSDGQRFATGGRADSTGHVNPKYGSEPGRLFYTHISDQYAPFSTKLVNVGVRDSTYVLDGLLYHESDLNIEEHYTDTAGFTDHVFALMHMLGFRFAPRIRDLKDTKLFIPKNNTEYAALKPMIGGTLDIKHIRTHWDEILRLAASIKQGTVTVVIAKKLSLILLKLIVYSVEKEHYHVKALQRTI